MRRVSFPPARERPSRWLHSACWLALAFAAVACGVRGPPRPPTRELPPATAPAEDDAGRDAPDAGEDRP